MRLLPQPWYLCTLAVAEQLYDALIVWNQVGSLNVTSTSLAFFQQFDSSVTAGTYASSSTTFTTLTSAIKTFADGFVAVVAKYTPSSGALSEQYDKSSGSQLSASDLTWSYASALTASICTLPAAPRNASRTAPNAASTADTCAADVNRMKISPHCTDTTARSVRASCTDT